MSRLQDLVNKLVQVIAKYNTTQTQKRHDLSTLISKSDTELNSELDKLIADATTTYSNKAPLLHYFLYVINITRPLLNSGKLLEPGEEARVEELLSKLLLDCKTLLKTPQSSIVNVSYGNTIIDMPGLIGFYRTTNSAQVLTDGLFNPLKLELPETTDTDIVGLISKLMSKHQLPLKAVRLSQLNDQLSHEKFELQDALKSIRAELRTEQEKLRAEQEKTADLIQQLSTAKKQIGTLETDLEAKQSSHSFLQKRLKISSDEISKLRVENSELRSTYGTPMMKALIRENQRTAGLYPTMFFNRVDESSTPDPDTNSARPN